MKYYLSGAITSQPNFKEYFLDYEIELRRYTTHEDFIFNPASVNWPQDVLWETCMKYDIKFLLNTDYLVLLPNWRRSKGVKVEMYLCRKLGIQIVRFNELIKELTKNAF